MKTNRAWILFSAVAVLLVGLVVACLLSVPEPPFRTRGVATVELIDHLRETKEVTDPALRRQILRLLNRSTVEKLPNPRIKGSGNKTVSIMYKDGTKDGATFHVREYPSYDSITDTRYEEGEYMECDLETFYYLKDGVVDRLLEIFDSLDTNE